MNRFSDLQDINTVILVGLKLSPISNNGMPSVTVMINNTVIYSDNISDPIILTHSIELLSPIYISIELSKKIYHPILETAVVIDYLQFDGIDMIPRYTHHASYTNDHNNNQPTSYLGFNGTWQLDIPKPFYHWFHDITGQGLLLQ